MDVLAWAHCDRRVLVTLDRDFGRLIFYEHREAPDGVILMRARPSSATQVIERFLAALDANMPDPCGRFLVIEADGSVRVTKLQ